MSELLPVQLDAQSVNAWTELLKVAGPSGVLLVALIAAVHSLGGRMMKVESRLGELEKDSAVIMDRLGAARPPRES